MFLHFDDGQPSHLGNSWSSIEESVHKISPKRVWGKWRWGHPIDSGYPIHFHLILWGLYGGAQPVALAMCGRTFVELQLTPLSALAPHTSELGQVQIEIVREILLWIGSNHVLNVHHNQLKTVLRYVLVIIVWFWKLNKNHDIEKKNVHFSPYLYR